MHVSCFKTLLDNNNNQEDIDRIEHADTDTLGNIDTLKFNKIDLCRYRYIKVIYKLQSKTKYINYDYLPSFTFSY